MVPSTMHQLQEHARRRFLPTQASAGPQAHPSGTIPSNNVLQRFGKDALLFDVSNDDLKPASIYRGDQLVVDRNRVAARGDVVVILQAADGFAIKRLRKRRGA